MAHTTGQTDKPPCPHCNGRGVVFVKGSKPGDTDAVVTCPVCRGTKTSDGLIRK